MAVAPSWSDLNLTVLHAPDTTVEQAIYELIANAFDANAAAGVARPPEIVVTEDAALHIRDEGAGIARHSFVIGRSRAAAPSSLGQFGIGLKDAIAALLRERATVTISSSQGSAAFDERLGDGLVPTIHLLFDPGARAAVGSTVVVTGLPDPASVATAARNGFLRLGPLAGTQPLAVFNTGLGPVSVYDAAPLRASGARETCVFVNGAKKDMCEPLVFAYNVDVSVIADAERLFGRDHAIRFRATLRDAIAAGIRALPPDVRARLSARAPARPSCELANWPGLRELFYPEQPPAAVIPGPAVAALAAARAAPVANNDAAPPAVILFDFENAHNAAGPLQAQALAQPAWRVLVFAGASTNLGAVQTSDRVEIVRAETDAPEAADSVLCFRAGLIAALAAPAPRFVIVCGAERRYLELIAQLHRRGHAATIVRYFDGRRDEFVDSLLAATQLS